MDRVDGLLPSAPPLGIGANEPLAPERRVNGSLAAGLVDHPELNDEEAIAAILHERRHFDIHPPPLPAQGNRAAAAGGLRVPSPPPQVQADGDDASASEHDTEDEDTSADDSAAPRRRWVGIVEDKSAPCQDELEYIASREERSASDHAHWEKETYFGLDDAELIPGACGRIDWLVEKYNGTKEDPNTERIMRSPVVQIGGLDWQIKFYPRGNHCDYLSAYIECVSMLSSDYAETEDFEDPPFPFLKGSDRIRRLRSVAAQFSLIMFNPSEPRVYEFKTEAHQFHKGGADFGWKYFSDQPHYEFHTRQHKQRQAILRDDRLGFTAYVRIVNDPSGCMWEHEITRSMPNRSVSVTGLRPFTKSMQYMAVGIVLLHFKPFREYIQQVDEKSFAGKWLQQLLLKMYTRKRSPAYGSKGSTTDCDAMEMLWRFSAAVAKENGSANVVPAVVQDIVGDFHAEKGTACGPSRLNTKEYSSIQEAVKHHGKPLSCPALLTLEMQRQEHDKKDRKWKKLTNKVEVQDVIEVGGHQYTLFAFLTHSGHLQSNTYNAYVRPKGIRTGWYAYRDGRVARLTEQQARAKHSGRVSDTSPSNIHVSDDARHMVYCEDDEPMDEVSCVVMYVREDYTERAFAPCVEESWMPPFLKTRPQARNTSSELEDNTECANNPVLCQGNGSAEAHAESENVAVLVTEAAGASTPEPEPLLMDGDDVVMRDADGDSEYSIGAAEAGSIDSMDDLEKGTVDWLGRPYYQGQIKDRKYHGGGHHIDVNGNEYLGSFESGAYHGYGKMIYSSTGDVYEGDWVDGQHHGRGKMTEHSTGNVFEGGWKEGRKHGDFVLRGSVTEEDRNCCTICYDKEISTAFFDCGHVIACRDCAAKIDTCPVCRRRVAHRLQLYGIKMSLS